MKLRSKSVDCQELYKASQIKIENQFDTGRSLYKWMSRTYLQSEADAKKTRLSNPNTTMIHRPIGHTHDHTRTSCGGAGLAAIDILYIYMVCQRKRYQHDLFKSRFPPSRLTKLWAKLRFLWSPCRNSQNYSFWHSVGPNRLLTSPDTKVMENYTPEVYHETSHVQHGKN